MKRLLSYLAILMLPHLSFGQQPFDAVKSIQALHQAGLVSDNERDSLLHWQEHPRISSEDVYLAVPDDPLNTPEGLLFQLGLFRSDSSVQYSSAYYDLFYFGASLEEIIHHAEVEAFAIELYGMPAPEATFYNGDLYSPVPDSVLARQRKLAAQLQGMGLLLPETMQQLPTEADYMTDLYSFYVYLASVTRYHRNYAQLREEELLKARNLVEAGVLTLDEFKHLQLDYRPRQLMGDCGLAGYSSRGFPLTGDTLNEAVSSYLTQLGQQLLARMPLQGGTHFRVKREKANLYANSFSLDFSDSCWVAYLDYQGRTYAQSFGIYDYAPTPVNVGLSEFRHVFNKVLTDAGSDYRLHYVEAFGLRGNTIDTSAALIFMTESQRLGWDQENLRENLLSHYVPWSPFSEEIYGTDLSPTRVQGYFNEFDEVGLMHSLTPEEKKEAWEGICKANLYDVSHMFDFMPDLVYPLPYYIDGEQPYANVLGQIRDFTSGDFNPIKVKDGSGRAKEGEEFVVSYKLGKKHQVTLVQYPGSIDIAFYDSIIQASASDEGAQLYYVRSQTGLMYLSTEQHQMLTRLCPDIFEATVYWEGE